MARQERREGVDRVVDTRVLCEADLGIGEEDHGSVGTIPNKLGLGETDGVVERQAEGLMGVLAALSVE